MITTCLRALLSLSIRSYHGLRIPSRRPHSSPSRIRARTRCRAHRRQFRPQYFPIRIPLENNSQPRVVRTQPKSCVVGHVEHGWVRGRIRIASPLYLPVCSPGSILAAPATAAATSLAPQPILETSPAPFARRRKMVSSASSTMSGHGRIVAHSNSTQRLTSSAQHFLALALVLSLRPFMG